MSVFIETESSIISFEKPDLVRSVSKPDSQVTLEAVLENADAVKGLVQGRPFYLLIVTEESATYTKEAREYIDMDTEVLKKAEALVVRSLAHRILGTFYARTRRKRHPIRLFPTVWEALEWFDTLRAREQQ